MNRTTSPAFLVVIPAYKPDHHLVDLVKELSKNSIIGIVIVNDGSGEEYQPIFDALCDYQVHLLNHPTNTGKGSALKTGLRYVLDKFPRSLGAVTADADGQHAASDIISCGNSLLKYPQSLIIGTRNFSEPHVPLRSRLGNRITAMLYWYLTDEFIQDTQTGLRAFPKSLIAKSLTITGDRFEYEMNVLLEFVHQQIPMVQLPIQTIYRDNNGHSHFDSLKDSRRIYSQIADSLRPLAKAKITSSIVELIAILVMALSWTTLPPLIWPLLLVTIRIVSIAVMVLLPFTHYQEKLTSSIHFKYYLGLRLVTSLLNGGFVAGLLLITPLGWILLPFVQLLVFYVSYRVWNGYHHASHQVKSQ